MHFIGHASPDDSNTPAAEHATTPHEDAVLVASLLRKDRKATADFVASYSDSVYGFIRARLAPRYDQVDDLVQEVFLAAWQGLGQYRATGPLQAWILGIARHRVEDHYRQRLRAPDSIDDPEDESVTPATVFDFHKEFHRLLERDELQAKAQRILCGLPETYRLALEWRYWHETSAREMASKTGKTEKAIERLLARARAEFRERWIRA